MREAGEKQTDTPGNAFRIGGQRRGDARLLWEQKVPGSSPGAPTKAQQDKGSRTIPGVCRARTLPCAQLATA
jgi:hypothetical protein